MKRSMAWAPFTSLAGRRWIVGAWLVELAALAGIALWVDTPWRAIDMAIAAVILPAFVCWVAPAGSLLALGRAARELRLPRAGSGLAWRMALCLALNLLPAAGLIYAQAQDHDWAVYRALVVLCILLAELLVVMLPVMMLGFIGFIPLLLNQLPWSALDIVWSTPLRIAAALAIAAGEALLLWIAVRHYTHRAGSQAGPLACLLQHMSTSLGTSADPARAFRSVPMFMLPRQRLRPGEAVRRRVACLLGQPYAPGFMRRMLLVGGVLGTLMALLLARSLAQGSGSAGMALASAVSAALPWMAVSASVAASARLSTLFRGHAPDLSELQLLPGQGGRVERARRIAGLLVWRPLQALAVCAVVVAAVIWHSPLAAAAPAVLGAIFMVGAISALEAARYLERGESWFGHAWIGSVLILAVVLLGTILMAFVVSGALPDDRLALTWLAAGALLLAYGLWRGRRAVQRAADHPPALAPRADRASAGAARILTAC